MPQLDGYTCKLPAMGINTAIFPYDKGLIIRATAEIFLIRSPIERRSRPTSRGPLLVGGVPTLGILEL